MKIIIFQIREIPNQRVRFCCYNEIHSSSDSNRREQPHILQRPAGARPPSLRQNAQQQTWRLVGTGMALTVRRPDAL